MIDASYVGIVPDTFKDDSKRSSRVASKPTASMWRPMA